MEYLDIRRKQYFAVQQVIAGRLPAEDAMVIAALNKDQMGSLVRHALMDFEFKGMFPPNSPPWHLTELVWRLNGVKQCISFHFHGKYASYGAFVTSKLETDPDTFTDEELELLCIREPAFKPFIDGVISKRLASDIVKLRGQGAQFTNDIATVKRRLSEYNFTRELNELLDKVDDELLKPSDAFDDAATIKHVRTFYEKLQQQVACALRDKKSLLISDGDLTKNIKILAFFKQHGLLTAKMHDFSNALYGVLSNEGVHAIKSTQEYLRLCRNMVAEYALVLFFELDRRLK